MADVTKLEEMEKFQWSRPDDPNPHLTAPISDTATDIGWSAPPLDKDGKIVSGATIIGIKNITSGYTESVYIPAGKIQGYGNVPDSTNKGLTCTDAVRGINLAGIDITTGNADLAVAHGQDSAVFCNISACEISMIDKVLLGEIASGGTSIKFGDETASDIKRYFENDQTDVPYDYYDESGKRLRMHMGDDALGGANQEWEMTIPIGTTVELAAMTDLPNTGMIAGDTTLGEIVFREGGAWVQKTGGGSVPDASTTVAGKVEIATSAESKAGTDTGGTGAKLTVLPSDIAANVQDSAYVYGEPSGGTDAYAFDAAPAVGAYAAGQRFIFKADVANTGACTLNVNSLGAKTIKKKHDKDLLTGDIEADGIIEVVYDGTNFQMTNELATVDDSRDYGDGSDGALTCSLGSEEAKDSETGGGTQESVFITNYPGCAWSFTAASSYLATSIKVELEKIASPTGTLTFTLYRVNKDAENLELGLGGSLLYNADSWGTKLAASSVNVTTITSGSNEYEFVWDADAHIVEGEKYVVEMSGLVAHATNYLKINSSSTGTGEHFWRYYINSGSYVAWLELEQSGYFTMMGKSNAVELDTHKVYQFSSIDIDDDCQIIPTRSAFQNQPIIVKCQGDCDLEGAYINAQALGCDDLTALPFGGTDSVNGGTYTDEGLRSGVARLKYGVFCGGKGGITNQTAYSYAEGGDGGGAFVLAVGGDLNMTNTIVDVRGESGWTGYLISQRATGGGGGGGGGGAAIWYAGTLTGTPALATGGGEKGWGGYAYSGTVYSPGAGGGGSTDGEEGTAGSGDDAGDGGDGGDQALVIGKYF